MPLCYGCGTDEADEPLFPVRERDTDLEVYLCEKCYIAMKEGRFYDPE